MTKKIDVLPPLRTVAETAERLKTSEKTVRRLIGSGALVAHYVGRSVRIADGDLAAYLEKQRGRCG